MIQKGGAGARSAIGLAYGMEEKEEADKGVGRSRSRGGVL